jgi:hypothetical protein
MLVSLYRSRPPHYLIAILEVVDIAEWTAYFAFDAMGELGFGADFGMIRTGKPYSRTG